MIELSAEELQDFQSLIKKVGECWFWLGKYHQNQPVFIIKEHPRRVKKMIATWKNKYAAKGQTKQLCQNNQCINPDHLLLTNCDLEISNYEELLEALNSYIEKTESCWLWNGPMKHNKPVYYNFKKRYEVRVILYESLKHKKLLPNQYLKNICKNEECVKPSHNILARHLTT